MPIMTAVGENMCFSYVGELTLEVYVIVCNELESWGSHKGGSEGVFIGSYSIKLTARNWLNSHQHKVQRPSDARKSNKRKDHMISERFSGENRIRSRGSGTTEGVFYVHGQNNRGWSVTICITVRIFMFQVCVCVLWGHYCEICVVLKEKTICSIQSM